MRILGWIAGGRAVLFGRSNGYLGAPIADEGDGEGEEVSWLLGPGKLETRRSHLTGDLPSLIVRQREKWPHLGEGC
jgi:hypothetical protein